MIVVAGTVAIKPENRDEAVRSAIKMADATKPEAGCITYDFWTDLRDGNLFHVFEEWESQEALEAHFATTHMAEFLSALPSFVASGADIKRYEVNSVSQLM